MRSGLDRSTLGDLQDNLAAVDEYEVYSCMQLMDRSASTPHAGRRHCRSQ